MRPAFAAPGRGGPGQDAPGLGRAGLSPPQAGQRVLSEAASNGFNVVRDLLLCSILSQVALKWPLSSIP
jgi:hypothetical protein